jgi:hypothetical protein
MLDILNKYPKAADVIREWFTEVMIASLNTDTIPEDFKEMVRANKFDNEKISNILKYQPRSLFDVFDKNDIIVIIKYHNNFGFTWAVEEVDEQSFYKTRIEAEYFAIEAAFEILEQKLSEDEVTE